jgi:hypothetical protein
LEEIAKLKKSTILCALLLLSLSASEAFGCVCELEPNTTPEKIGAARLSAFEKATVVFSGEVVAKDLITVKFKVDKIWKGEESKEITMLTGTKDNGDGTITPSTCDYWFEKGKQYLIYAYGPVAELKTHKCSRTMLLKDAETEMIGLDEITPHKAVALSRSRRALQSPLRE